VKLQRSAADGKIFDLIDAVYDRYVAGDGKRNTIEVWKLNRQVPEAAAGTLLRIQASSPFLLHWTSDEWQHSTDTQSRATGVGIEFVDILLPQQKAPIRFTFLWVEENCWEGKDYKVEIQARAETQVRMAVSGNNVA
jgi:glucoamylase